ncbi:MAG: flagellar assembly regulator FliX, partial [Caulobacterales bacterium]|nr:flagellar assembly regulator FliX [Caulobacterales bacterium]
LTGAPAAAPAGPAAAAGGVASVDALLALQGAAPAGGARERAASRGEALLGALDELRLDLLSGGDGPCAAHRLHELRQEMRERTGETELDEVLDQIEVRAAVELAKRERRGGA